MFPLFRAKNEKKQNLSDEETLALASSQLPLICNALDSYSSRTQTYPQINLDEPLYKELCVWVDTFTLPPRTDLAEFIRELQGTFNTYSKFVEKAELLDFRLKAALLIGKLSQDSCLLATQVPQAEKMLIELIKKLEEIVLKSKYFASDTYLPPLEHLGNRSDIKQALKI